MQTAPMAVYLGLGANVGTESEIIARFDAAAAAIGRLPGTTVDAGSGIYRSAPWGVTDQDPFLNTVIRVRTTVEPVELLVALKRIESDLGRVPTYRWGPRLIDIDILLWEGVAVNGPGLTIPHAHLCDRAFAFVPLLELDNDARLPDGSLLRDATRCPAGDHGLTRLR